MLPAPATRRALPWLGAIPLLLAPAVLAADDSDPPVPDPPLIVLPEVAVTAARSERDVLETPGNVTVIDRAAIDRSGALSVPDLLRREAGIFVTQGATSPEGYGVEARGFNNGSGVGSSLLVLVDGRRVNEPDSSVTDWALTHLDHVERIEIIRGPASAVYGDNAVGGVIQIITRAPEGPLRATLRGRTGTFDRDGGSLALSGSHGPLGASLFVEGDGQDGYRDRSDFRTRTLDAKLRFSHGGFLEATLLAGYSSDDRNRPGSLSREDIARLGRRAADPRATDDFADVRQRFVQGILEARPAEGVRLRAVPYYRRRNDRAAITEAAFGGRTEFQTETEALGLTTEAELRSALLGLPSVSLFGVDLLHEEVDSDTLSPGPFVFDRDSRRRTIGAFLQGEIRLTDGLWLSGGGRFDHASYRLRDTTAFAGPPSRSSTRPDYNVWSSRAALTYRVSEGVSTYVSYSRGFRFPNLDETSGVFAANPEIRPQKSDAYEVGLKLRLPTFSANLAVYHMDVHDEILLDSAVVLDFFGTPFLGVQNVNVERVRHRGLELSASWRPREWLEIYGSYTLDATEIRRDSLTGLDSERVPVTPRHRGHWGARLRLPCWVELGIDSDLVGRRFAVNDFGHDLSELSKFAVYDALAILRPPLGEHLELALSAGVRNLFDRRYAELGGRSSFVDEADFAADPQSFSRSFPSPGRNYEFRITATVRR